MKLETANKDRASRRANQLMLDKLAKKAQLKKDANDKDLKNDADYNPLDDDDDSQDSVISDITAHAREVSKTTILDFVGSFFESRPLVLGF